MDYMEGKYRPRVLALLTKDVGGKTHVLARQNNKDRSSSPYHFPGGGTDGQPLLRAARREALEEVGYRINRPTIIQKPREYILHDKWKAHVKKKRGVDALGIKQSIVHGRLGKKDRRLYGSEGDAMEGARLYPIDEVIDKMDRFTRRVERGRETNYHPAVKTNRDLIETLRLIEKGK